MYKHVYMCVFMFIEKEQIMRNISCLFITEKWIVYKEKMYYVMYKVFFGNF